MLPQGVAISGQVHIRAGSDARLATNASSHCCPGDRREARTRCPGGGPASLCRPFPRAAQAAARAPSSARAPREAADLARVRAGQTRRALVRCARTRAQRTRAGRGRRTRHAAEAAAAGAGMRVAHRTVRPAGELVGRRNGAGAAGPPRDPPPARGARSRLPPAGGCRVASLRLSATTAAGRQGAARRRRGRAAALRREARGTPMRGGDADAATVPGVCSDADATHGRQAAPPNALLGPPCPAAPFSPLPARRRVLHPPPLTPILPRSMPASLRPSLALSSRSSSLAPSLPLTPT